MLATLSSAGAQTWTATLAGPSEVPPNTSPGTGQALITLSGSNLTINVTFRDLLFPTIASHIHCCTTVPGAGTAGVATPVPTFPGFPLGVTSGTYLNTFDLLLASSYNPAFLAASGGDVNVAMARLIAGMNSGTAYLNIHTTQFPGGEIRGFVVAPEPGTMLLLGSGLAGIAAARPRRRRTRA
jgi:hypothetical protein